MSECVWTGRDIEFCKEHQAYYTTKVCEKGLTALRANTSRLRDFIENLINLDEDLPLFLRENARTLLSEIEKGSRLG